MNTPVIICVDCDVPLAVSTVPNKDSSAVCPVCKINWECAAITLPRAKPDLTPKAKEGASASCFNHADNEAETECSCGKLLCKVCAFSQFGKPLCVNCFISDKQNPDLKKNRLVRYDWMANYAIGLTFITLGLGAPLAIYFLIRHLMSGEEPIYGGKIAASIKLVILLGLTLLIGGSILFGLFQYFFSHLDH